MRSIFLFGAASAALLTATGADAQAARQHDQQGSRGDNVLLAAEDAFGERIGIEQVGLYSEGQSRGFSLANTGAYRIDGAYFAPSIGLMEPLIGGVSVRLGVNAARLDYPSPSGVVNYRLRSAPPEKSLSFGLGDRHFGSYFAELNGSATLSDGKLSIAGGIFAQPRTNRPDGGEGELFYAGIVPIWQPSDNLRIRGLAGHRRSDFSGSYAFAVSAEALAAEPKSRTFYGPAWSQSTSSDSVVGAIVDWAPAEDWRVSTSNFYSVLKPEFTDFTLLTVRPDGDASATQIRTPDRTFTSLSSEARVTHRLTTGTIAHTIGLGARNRVGRSRTASGTSVALGVVNLDEPRFGSEPAFVDSGARTLDEVDQLTGSATYAALFGQKLELRGGLHLSRYKKSIAPPVGAASERTANEWLYNLSGVYLFDQKTTIFASYVKGLEEAGVAPQIAVNRGEILPPVIAQQYELGLRRKLGPNLTLIGAVFDISKPTPGLRSDGVYTFVGQVRHRGAELSLNGRLGTNTTIVAGAVAMERRLSGELVEAGRVGEKPAGIPPLIAFASVDQPLPVNGLSIDGRISYSAVRPANTLNTLETPSVTTVDLGGRYNFKLGLAPAVLRVTVVNLFNEREWVASTGGTMSQTAPRFLRANLTVKLTGV